MPLEIDYRSEGFPASSPVNNGGGVLQTTWDELLWAALTVGRPNRHYVFRHGTSSSYEALFRCSLVRMALEQRRPSAHRLRRTSAAKTLDPSEKGAVNYFLGMTMCRLFSAKLLSVPWLLHLDVFRPMLNPVLAGRSRPDLVGQTLSNEWVSIESKGRVGSPGAEAKHKAKEQAQRLIGIDGQKPRFHVGCITYFRSEVLQFFWRDPEPDRNRPRNPIELSFEEGILRHCYKPILNLIASQSQHLDNELYARGLIPIEDLDIKVSVHPGVFELLAKEKWGELKGFCIREGKSLHEEGYQLDGIRIAAGPTWALPFKEFDVAR